MKHTILFTVVLFLVFTSCRKENIKTPPSEDPPLDMHTILLKDMIVKNLPSPYYHFDYDDSGFITNINYQSGLAFYDLSYKNGRIDKMTDNTPANRDKLQYFYKDGKVFKINFTNKEGFFYKQVNISYNSLSQLTKIEWNIINTDMVSTPEKESELEYYADGNLSKIKHHVFEIPGRQPEVFYTDSYENYDSKTNVDAFAAIQKINDHVFLLPNITIQKNNPLKEIHSGDGINYTIDYTYTYHDNLPIKKDGDLVILNGENAGLHSNYLVTFSYY